MIFEKEFISVSQLNTTIKNIFIQEEMLHNISVAGEVSGIKVSGAHAYFTLKDATAEISCCCFNYIKTYLPKSGELVVVTGSPDFYIKGGKLSLNVTKLRLYGAGLLALEFEKLKVRLLEAGLFDEKYKQAIPRFCKKICVITSLSGAVIRDIVTTIRKKNSILDIDIYNTKVQGFGSATDIAAAVEAVDTLGYDTIIIARGGGSFEDLMPFNEEVLVKAIFIAKTPIISAVGHETDFTLCDMVADLRLPTPTAAAEFIAIDTNAVAEKIVEIVKYARKVLQNNLMDKLGTTISLIKEMNNCAKEMVAKKEFIIKSQLAAMQRYMAEKLDSGQNLTSNMLTRLDANNPAKILAQGYFRVFKQGQGAHSVADIALGDKITIKGGDGEIGATVDIVKIKSK